MRLSAGEHPARLPLNNHHDEIGKLTCAYNSMVDQIETLFTSIRTESERKRQAEFHALQAQINPHFLYNTIDTLRALSLSGRTKEVNDLLRSLGEFYRNSINNGKSIITIGEEINMVKSYMAIQSVRYSDISTEFDVDETVCAAPIPKLVLQPLVENALYHGLRSSGQKGTIWVRAWQDADNVYLSVSDNGIGISEEALTSALKNDPTEEESRFGLRGTIDRLRLFYGESQPVTIERTPGCGTRIIITIKKKGGDAT
jgi:two-component system sensor histidine kinase YesM